MARRARAEPACVSDPADAPREMLSLVGHEQALERVSRAIRGGRPPQAWLICGAPGVGKATFAFRVARYLLRYGATDQGAQNLSVAANDPAAMLVRAGAHPGLIVLKRGTNAETGKPMTVLGVNEIRKLGNFFGLTSGAGGWRIAIIDTADDMNDNASNALLKILEEPPARALLLLLANSSARLLPTIRSRCQRLQLKPLSDADVEAVLAQRLPGLSDAERAALAALAAGSIGTALKLASNNGAALAAEAERLIDQAGKPDVSAILGLAEKISRMDDGVSAFGQYLAQVLTDRVRARAKTNGRDVFRWAQLLDKIETNFRRADALYLEPRQTILSAARALAGTARRGAL
ncbi:MAG TPA: DNA polymerase III subunit delta' [Rhizomicrobium sp.]